MKLVVKHMVSLRVIADSHHHQLQMMTAHARNGRRQMVAMAEHSLTPQLMVAKLRATVMICVADFVSALAALVAVVVTVAILDFLIIVVIAVIATVIVLAAVDTTAIRAVAVSKFTVFAAASFFLVIKTRSTLF